MKISFETEDRLCLRDRPLIILFGLGLLCVLFGYGLWSGTIPSEDFPWPFVIAPLIAFASFLYYYEVLEVVFDRRIGCVQLTRKRLMRTFETNHDIDALTKVGIIGTGDLDGGTHRIALYFENLPKPVPLTFYETNGASVSETAARIEAWLERGNP